jgi:hypothetical protein
MVRYSLIERIAQTTGKRTISIGVLVTLLVLSGTLLLSIPGCGGTHLKTNVVSTTTASVTETASAYPYSPSYSAPADISLLSDGQTVRVNLVKFSGRVPSANTSVLVNNNAVTIDNHGNYYVYLDLNKGQNNIEIKTINSTETKTEIIHIDFVPPLTIHLDMPGWGVSTDLDNPLSVTGVVSNPAAEVKVNGKKVDVNVDGTFVVQTHSENGNNRIEAIARFGNETDESALNWYTADNGQLLVGLGPTTPPYNLPSVALKAGESTNFDFYLMFDKGIQISPANSILITRIVKMGDANGILPMLPDLKIRIAPSAYSVFPGIKYYSQVTIDTSPDLEPGDYYFRISSSLQGVFTDYPDITRIGGLNNRITRAYFVVSIK